MSAKKSKMRILSVSALVFLMVASVGLAIPAMAASGDQLAAQPYASSSNDTFTAAWFGTFIDTLNPFQSYSQLTNWVNMNTYLPLVYYDSGNHTYMPGLATSWTLNFNNGTAIFNLNPNAVWSDGVPVTASDVVFTYHAAEQPTTFICSETTAITNVTALNPHQVMISFQGVLWGMFAPYIFIVPEHIWSHVNVTTYAGYNQTSSGAFQSFVGDGPFLLSNYVANQYAEITANPSWYIANEKPQLKNVIFEEFSSQSAAITALQSGSVNGLARMLPTNLPSFSNNSAFSVNVSQDLEYLYLSINVDAQGTGNHALLNLLVREAMAHAINTTYLAADVFQGYAKTTASVLAPTNQYYDHSLSLYSYNLSLANQLLNQSGYTHMVSGVRQNSTGASLTFNELVPSGDQQAVDLANLIATNLSAIGIKVNVQAESTGSMSAVIWTSNGTLGQDMDLWDWFDNVQTSPQLLSVFLSGQVVTGTSDSGFNNTTFDQCWNNLTLNATSVSQATSISNTMQQILHDQIPYIPLVVPEAINVWSSSFTNVSTSMPGGPFGGGDWLTFIQMTPASSPSHPTTSNNDLYYIIGGVVAAVIVIAVVAVLAMRGRNRTQ